MMEETKTNIINYFNDLLQTKQNAILKFEIIIEEEDVIINSGKSSLNETKKFKRSKDYIFKNLLLDINNFLGPDASFMCSHDSFKHDKVSFKFITDDAIVELKSNLVEDKKWMFKFAYRNYSEGSLYPEYDEEIKEAEKLLFPEEFPEESKKRKI